MARRARTLATSVWSSRISGPGARYRPRGCPLSAAPRRLSPDVRDQPSQDGLVGGQLEVVDAGVVRKAEAVAAHPPPDPHGVVGDVLLVDVALAGQEGGRHRVEDLSDREVRERRADGRVDARALLGVD